MADGREPSETPSIKEVKAPPPEAKKKPRGSPSRRGFLKGAGGGLVGLVLAETGLGAWLAACAPVPPDRHSYRHIPDTLTDPDARMYWERFEFRADTTNGRITLNLTDAGRRAIYPGTQISGEWVRWKPNLNDLYNAASMHADFDGFSIDYDRFAAGLIGKYGTPDPKHPEKETILMQKGNEYVLNPNSEFAIFELPGDCFRKKESGELPESAAQPAGPPPATAVDSATASATPPAKQTAVSADQPVTAPESSVLKSIGEAVDAIPFPVKVGGAAAAGLTGFAVLEGRRRRRPIKKRTPNVPSRPTHPSLFRRDTVSDDDGVASTDIPSRASGVTPTEVLREADRTELALSTSKYPLRVISTYVSPDGSYIQTLEEGTLRSENIASILQQHPSAILSKDPAGHNIIIILGGRTIAEEPMIVEGPSLIAGKVPPLSDYGGQQSPRVVERHPDRGYFVVRDPKTGEYDVRLAGREASQNAGKVLTAATVMADHLSPSERKDFGKRLSVQDLVNYEPGKPISPLTPPQALEMVRDQYSNTGELREDEVAWKEADSAEEEVDDEELPPPIGYPRHTDPDFELSTPEWDRQKENLGPMQDEEPYDTGAVKLGEEDDEPEDDEPEETTPPVKDIRDDVPRE